ncbi:MAG TPA: discoidin domain-containing protein [Polyangiaceae bacterium]|jgi:hypothetical protein
MPFLATVTDPIREFFTLGRAERTIRAYVPAQHARIREQVDAANRRLSAGRRLAQAVPAAILLREAVVHYLVALAASRDADAGEQSRADLPELPPEAARPRAKPSDDARVREAIAAGDPLYFDRLPAEDVERSRWALDRAASMLRRRVEARSIASVRGTRWGRVAAIVLVILYAVITVVRAKVLPQNIALNKPVRPSSRKHNPPDGHELVDGDLGTSFGIHTNTEDDPNVVIELQDRYWIDSIKVYNRVDGWYDDCLPLVVELSNDGVKYEVLGRREEHFGTDPPWTIDGRGKPARFVRLRVDRRSYLALSEVEIYGKKD